MVKGSFSRGARTTHWGAESFQQTALGTLATQKNEVEPSSYNMYKN